MKTIPEDLYNKIVKVSKQVHNELRRKGIVVPVKNRDGSIRIGSYTVVKTDSDFYEVLDHNQETVIKHINLPQTAAMLANNLALGRFVDKALLETDQHYGYALFEEQLQQRAIERSRKKSLEYFELALSKHKIAKTKKEIHKKDIVRSFEKLRNLV
jgi:hypothetical protein